MLKFLRYALATVCFAASVGCLALWCWALRSQDQLLAARFRLPRGTIVCQVYRGGLSMSHATVPVRYSGPNPLEVRIVGGSPLVNASPGNASLDSLTLPLTRQVRDRWYVISQVGKHRSSSFGTGAASGRMFGYGRRRVYFPLWYAALIFTLAGVAALRLGRRFTLRSAIIATTVVAGLLGMAAAL